jgi:uncharacterized protein (TIGR03067 family)
MLRNMRWLISAATLATATALSAVEPFDNGPKPSSSTTHDLSSADGVWVVATAASDKQNRLSEAWFSKITIETGKVAISRFCGSASDLKGTFKLDPTATPNAVDLNVDEIDLSDLWEGVKYPKCTLHGIYKLDGDSLTICVRTRSDVRPPSDFVANDRDTVVLSLVRTGPKFKDFPKDITVFVKDQAGKPAAGASLFQFMSLHRDPKKRGASAEWAYSEITKTRTDGTARVAYGDLSFCPIAARDADRKLTGFASVSPASSLNGAVNVILSPECHVRGKIVCDALTKAGKPIGWTYAYLLYAGQRIGGCALTPGEFEFQIPPGSYSLDVYGENLRDKHVDVTVPEGQTEFQVPPIALIASRLKWLEGYPAPELDGVVAWRGAPVKLADLKGKYVLIDFWGYWCGPCVGAMPVLIDLHERFHDKGLAIIGVHVDLDGEVDTPAKLDEKTAAIKKKLWSGKELPFPVALTCGTLTGGDQPSHGPAAEQYGILSYPTTILIDREGKVVGKFNARFQKDAIAEIEELLKK